MAKSSSQSVNRINIVSMDPFIEITLRYFAKREADSATTTSTGNMCPTLLSACP